jgi:hypothetical protein
MSGQMQIIATSLFIQWLKVKMGTTPWGTLGILLLVAVAASPLYTIAVSTGFWPVIRDVLIRPGAFYAFIIQRFNQSR